MSRAQRRSTRTTARSRRTPVRPQTRAGFQVPWIPIAVLLFIVAVAGVVGYLIIQANKPAKPGNAKAAAYEQLKQEGAPGEWVDLPDAWADGTKVAHYGQSSDLGPNTNAHVQHDVDYSKETSPNSSTGLPPAGGPHWGSSTCGADPDTAPNFCGPVEWGIYRKEWHAENLVHNMEHSGVIIWYNTTDTNIRDQIEAEATKFLDNKALIVVLPYSNMPADTIALTAWARRDLFPVSQFSTDRIDAFVKAFVCRFNPEHFPCKTQ